MCKFSVITVCYNAISTIAATMMSVLNQTYDNIEYIIVDGDSDDGTQVLIKEIQNKEGRITIKIISEPDRGIYDAMNKGICMATGDYLIFMNCGDKFYDDNVLENIWKNIEIQNNMPIMIYGNYATISNGEISPVIPARDYKKVWYGMFASHQSMFYNRQFLVQHNLFYDTSYKIAADYKLTLQVVTFSKNILQTDICVSLFDLTGFSNKNQNLGLYEADRVRKDLGYSYITRKFVVILQLFARFIRNDLKGLYKILRH